jgi:hypothetical protein
MVEYSDAYELAMLTADVAMGGISISRSAKAGWESIREKRRDVAGAKCIFEDVCVGILFCFRGLFK